MALVELTDIKGFLPERRLLLSMFKGLSKSIPTNKGTTNLDATIDRRLSHVGSAGNGYGRQPRSHFGVSLCGSHVLTVLPAG